MVVLSLTPPPPPPSWAHLSPLLPSRGIRLTLQMLRKRPWEGSGRGGGTWKTVFIIS